MRLDMGSILGRMGRVNIGLFDNFSTARASARKLQLLSGATYCRARLAVDGLDRLEFVGFPRFGITNS